ncbi:hypothetical protein SAMN05877809_107126 [Rhodobacter sp. JA431]|uniref:DUF1284 domain-containing protein n=1 Tax=Rhodobacter sp. JA431 TaxID=570013 RepID=UPI000BCDF568|nr:DUF1284 domain-containing protein [Rhodobacter sp. JA431]SOC14299.1 hypothetical protein SAMN05877809_107126 [Rhodobacter sp. JA431]
MTIRLRPHHLLCMLSYAGSGYTPAFTVNMSAIMPRLGAGEEIEIVTGPDDICAPLLDEPEPHCHGCSVTARDAAAARDVGALLGIEIMPGATLHLTAERITALRAAFASDTIRAACRDCQWDSLCRDVAAAGFANTPLHPV